MNYTELLKDIRFDLNLTQQDVANHLNINRSTYKDYELQNRIIPLKHLITLCNYFDISIDYLFNLTKRKKYSLAKKDINKDLFTKRFKDFRKEKKLTQEELADFLQTSHSFISNCDNGKSILTTSYLYAICKKYNISADYLLGRIDTPKYLIN